MSSVASEYLGFIASLLSKDVPDDVKRMANLVFRNLQVLAEVGAVKRARSTRLVSIALRDFLKESTLLPLASGTETGIQRVTRLNELRVGPFRGFMRQEVFDLSKDITLVYGANGTGKSSFCEALEIALLGSVSEARAKRIDLRAYCNNARLGRHQPPVILATTLEQSIQRALPSEEKYRFSFIEKNRIDDFSRIAARTPGDQKQLIATLFGIDQFSDFVRGFNQSIDENFDLIGQKRVELIKKRQQLAAAEQVIRENPSKISKIDEQEKLLASKYYSNVTYAAMCEWLLGTAEKVGRLAHVKALLDQPAPRLYGVTPKALSTLLDQAYRANELLEKTSGELAKRSGEISYKQLYESLLGLISQSPNSCPACGTDLTLVTQNPYDRARAGLSTLAELAELQGRASSEREVLQQSIRNLHFEMRRAIEALSIACPGDLSSSALPSLPIDIHGAWLQPWVDGDRRAWIRLLELSAKVEEMDAASHEAQRNRSELTEERKRLDELRIDIERLRTVRSEHSEIVQSAHSTVAKFEVDNAELIALVEREASAVQFNLRVKQAYDQYLSELKIYLDSLPASLLQGLGGLTKELYNAFNRDDPPSDLIEHIWLPLQENGRIEIEFAMEPGVRYDALQVLSEGHIRCVGLSILLAKNISEECPFVIFDDVVNAIDDEHRNGIWRTFFESGFLGSKQIILTSHAQEFLHRIQQELGSSRVGQTKFYKFLPHLNDHELRVDSNPETKNYVLLAAAAVESDDRRDALRHSRAGLESLTDRLWTWLGRRGDGRLELKISGPRSPIELNNKCLKLRSSLQRIQPMSQPLAECVEALNVLLNVSGASIEWSYLNAGTHDSQRDGEFDTATVNAIVGAIVSLDSGLERLRGGS